jgi:Putative Flp pilus-assembly TadE/G-like
MTGRPPDDQGRGQAGSLSVFVPVLVIIILTVGGFAFDGANALTAKRRAVNVAEQAARAGAGQIDLASVRSGGEYRIDRGKARRAAQGYLAAAGYPGQVTLGRDAIGDRVDVAVTWFQRGIFAAFVGRSGYGGIGRASAHVCHGVAQEEGC